MERKIEVNAQKCIRCGLCIKDCFVNCLEFDENKIPKFAEGGLERCMNCQHCMTICPKAALSINGKNPDNSLKTSYANADELLNLIKSRRSFRQYKNENVPADKLEKIKEMLSFAPTGVNMNYLHFSVVETKEKMEEIRQLSYKLIEEKGSNTQFLPMCLNAYKNGNDMMYRGATSMVAVAVDMQKAAKDCETTDPIIALSYLELYAQSLGLGTLWCDIAYVAVREYDELKKLLEIPDNYTIAYVMLLGVPAVKYPRTSQPEQFSVKKLK